jgi:hypothetical protein
MMGAGYLNSFLTVLGSIHSMSRFPDYNIEKVTYPGLIIYNQYFQGL